MRVKAYFNHTFEIGSYAYKLSIKHRDFLWAGGHGRYWTIKLIYGD